MLMSGCSGTGSSAPSTLMDGTRVANTPVTIQDASGPTVLTKVRVVSSDEIPVGSLAARCLRGWASGTHPVGRIVERIGVTAETVTLREASGLDSCENTLGAREGNRAWCGGAFGRLYAGHLRDPHLSLAGCETADGKPVASAWVEPVPGARYVVVRQPGYTEVYPTAAGLPVRVSTVSGFHRDPLGVTFEISDHDGRGRMLHRYRLDAFPAG